jgi:hypothetical protein
MTNSNRSGWNRVAIKMAPFSASTHASWTPSTRLSRATSGQRAQSLGRDCLSICMGGIPRRIGAVAHLPPARVEPVELPHRPGTVDNQTLSRMLIITGPAVVLPTDSREDRTGVSIKARLFGVRDSHQPEAVAPPRLPRGPGPRPCPRGAQHTVRPAPAVGGIACTAAGAGSPQKSGPHVPPSTA